MDEWFVLSLSCVLLFFKFEGSLAGSGGPPSACAFRHPSTFPISIPVGTILSALDSSNTHSLAASTGLLSIKKLDLCRIFTNKSKEAFPSISILGLEFLSLRGELSIRRSDFSKIAIGSRGFIYRSMIYCQGSRKKL